MKYIASWSGGKDSTASIILAHEHNEPLDIILFSEVMFDIKNNISGENPRHIEFIKSVAKPLFESWGYEVRILRADRDYLDFFNRVIEKPRIHTEHKGMKFGFPVYGRCGVKRDLKIKPIIDFYKTINEPIIQYVGLCIDEPQRLESMHKDKFKVSLLEKYKYTEQMAKDLCIQYGLFSPCYELSKRGGCWFCPNAKIEEHKEIKALYPDVWDKFKNLEKTENVAHNKFNPFGMTIEEIDERIKWEDAQMTIFDFIK